MSDQLFERAVSDWLEDGSDRTPRSAIDGVLLAVRTTPQERDLRIPWRMPRMPALTRATGIAAVALVAVVGAGSVIYLASNRSGGGVGSQVTPPPTNAATTAPSTAPTPQSSTYTSKVYGFALGYPADWSVNAPATRTWQPGDTLYSDPWPFADTFISPGSDQDQIGLFAWEMPAGEGADIESVQGLKAWAAKFCTEVGASSCDAFTQGAVPMCLNAGGDPCRAAILVPTASDQYAFFMDWTSVVFTNAPDRVTVISVAREDSFPAAARYGGSVALLKSVLTTMGVQSP